MKIQIGCGCLSLIGFLVLGLVLGGKCFNYVLDTLVGHTVPLWQAMLGSLITADLTIPAALICLILRSVGIHTPFFHVA